MNTFFALAIVVLLLCTIGCVISLIRLGRKIYRILDDHCVEFSEYRICLAQRIMAWEKHCGYSYNNAKKAYEKR